MKIQVSQVKDAQVNVPIENLTKGCWYRTGSGHYILIDVHSPYRVLYVSSNGKYFLFTSFEDLKYIKPPFQLMDSGFSVEICNSPVFHHRLEYEEGGL